MPAPARPTPPESPRTARRHQSVEYSIARKTLPCSGKPIPAARSNARPACPSSTSGTAPTVALKHLYRLRGPTRRTRVFVNATVSRWRRGMTALAPPAAESLGAFDELGQGRCHKCPIGPQRDTRPGSQTGSRGSAPVAFLARLHGSVEHRLWNDAEHVPRRPGPLSSTTLVLASLCNTRKSECGQFSTTGKVPENWPLPARSRLSDNCVFNADKS
ncbi:hypothetical protein C791_0670 [Amycolatopsis azurea DSM 43854]|uniref:Uncharacterized protein n=1 Tax=Amycolatopsis azurea DSM 43854 TaxID=1238180 RepID=M2P0P8_9PSEU|nr:hypothetical protein C791_0670 [Amycolatopsis azurea DSM 43854]